MTNWYDNISTPMDVNGEIVPLTTEAMYYGKRMCRVLRISYSPTDNVWIVQTDTVTAPVEAFSLHRPDSLKQLEEDLSRVVTNNGEFSTSSCAYANQRGDTCDGCKLHNNSGRVCMDRVFEDIISRIHKLAAKEEK